jgi:4-amino-4-deoxy-L-arabinose transferase-like glycosyltransferase
MTGNGHDPVRRAPRWQRIVSGLGFISVLGLALFVLLYRIQDEGLHWDEAGDLRAFYGLHPLSFAEILQELRRLNPAVTPVYFLIQFAWARTVGLTVLSMHLLSVLFSAGTLVVVFFIGRKLRGTWTGLWAMFLLAASPLHVYYSLEIRNYPLTGLLGALSLLTLLRGVERPGWRAWVLNFLVDVLLGMSHLFANLVFVAQAVFLLVCHRRRKVLLPWGLSHAVVAAAVGVWLRTCDFTAMHNAMAGAYMPPLTWEGASDMVKALTGMSYTWVGPIIGKSGVMGALIIVQFLAGVAVLLSERLLVRKASATEVDRRNASREIQGVFLLVLTVFVPPVLLALVTQFSSHCFVPRYAICSAVATPILLACAVTMLRTRTLRFVLAATLVLTNVSLLEQTLGNRPQRLSWTEMGRFLAQEVKREDYFVIFPASFGFFSMIEMLLPVTPEKIVRRETWSQPDLEELAAWHARGVQVWCVTGMDDRPNAEFETVLGSYDLPFTKHAFNLGRYVVYCIPAGAVEFAVHGDATIHAPLGSGRLRAWFAMEPGHPGAGMGLTQLASADHPYAPLFTRPSLSLESATSGLSGEEWQPWDSRHPMQLAVRFLSGACVDARWPINALANRLECRMRHAFSGKNAVDMQFDVTSDGTGSGQGPLVFTWVSHVRGACTPGK